MISIIICNRKKVLDPKLENNIKSTIGIEYEIINIDNSDNRYNIFQAYNKGIQKSKYPYICFMHDDILYHTVNWGKNIIDYFNDPAVGMIGVAGPTYISQLPGIWWGIENEKCRTDSIRQCNLDTDRFDLTRQHYTLYNPYNEKATEVVALDGLFFCIKKEIFGDVSFDESYNGFHFYDIDISLQIKSKGYKLLCVYDVLIEHISVSNLSLEWVKASRVFFNKWKKLLPITTCVYTEKQVKQIEENNLQTMLNLLSGNHVSLIKYYTLKELLHLLFHFKQFVWKKIKKRIF